MPVYNLFLSHSWSYHHHYANLYSLLRAAYGFQFRNYSIPRDDPIHEAKNAAQLQAAIRNQLAYSHAVIVLAGVYASYSRWIQLEVFLAKQFGKPIIAVEPFGAERTSRFVRENADRIVGWRTSSVVQAIRDLA